jgi:uncharacterized protein YqjF (DUF2071 family)
LDNWRGRTFVSLVGFLFLNTRVFGIPIPLHCNFEEVNLRFYVRRKTDAGWRRAVVFVKELVPRTAIALTARIFYGENYMAVPMSHRVEVLEGTRNEEQRHVTYRWKFAGCEQEIYIRTRGQSREIVTDSEEEFITEHYWGYARRRDGSTLEYQVKHPRWRIWTAEETRLECDVARLYGESFVEFLKSPPTSAFLAEGSKVTVLQETRLPPEGVR